MTEVQDGKRREKYKAIEHYIKTPNIVRRRLVIEEEGETDETHSGTFYGSQSLVERGRHHLRVSSMEHYSRESRRIVQDYIWESIEDSEVTRRKERRSQSYERKLLGSYKRK